MVLSAYCWHLPLNGGTGFNLWDLSVDSGSFDSSSVMETMRDAVHLRTSKVSPIYFTLVIPEKETSVFHHNHILKLEVRANQEGLSFNSFILKRLMFSVGFTDLENGSLWSKLENKTGEVSADGKIFSFRMRKRRSVDCRPSVKFLSSNISRSPQLLEAAQSEALQTSNYQRLTRNLSDDPSTEHEPPHKMARLEAGCFKPPVSSVMECEEETELRPSVETAREDESEVIDL